MKQTTNPNHLGYACINMHLSKKKITTNRSMIKRTFLSRGLPYASELALANCKDLFTILKWNEENNIRFFRLSSNLFPWASEYEITQLPNFELIDDVLSKIGDWIKIHNHRITFHPGPFNKLASADERIIKNTIRDLEIHGQIFDLLRLSKTPYNKINIHIGGHYNNKPLAIDNFCRNFEKLSFSVQSRLTVENDDKPSLYSTRELVEQVHSRIGTPIVHDLHHHLFCSGNDSNEEALCLAMKTWGNIIPVVHYSQSRSEEQKNNAILANAHSDSYWLAVNTYGHNPAVMLECKHKEIGLFKMRNLLS